MSDNFSELELSCIPQLPNITNRFNQIVENYPNHLAVVDGEGRLTYRDLHVEAQRVAKGLMSRGVRPGQGVMLEATRSWQTIASLLGILQAGAFYVPIDPDTPVTRALEMMSQCNAPFLIHLTPGWTLPIDPRLELDFARDFDPPKSDEGLAARGGTAAPVVSLASVSYEAPAYVNFTSGSTGIPKAVLVSHAGVSGLTCDVSYVNLRDQPIFLHMAPLSFDAATFEIFAPLLNGGTCVIHRNRIPELSQFGAFLRDSNVTHMWLTSSLFSWVVENQVSCLSGLKEIWVGGDVVSSRHVHMAYETHPSIEIVNGYGPTECTTFSTSYRIPRSLSAGADIPIGIAIDNTTCFVADNNLQAVVPGTVGELLIGGPRLALEYLNDQEKTLQKFPLCLNPKTGKMDRFFRTGDFAIEGNDGVFRFCGRRDRQVKIRGFRIELEEVESALRHLEGVIEALVEKRTTTGGDELTACVVMKPGRLGHAEVFRRQLGSSLPGHMVPATFVFLDKTPLNAHGKVDRSALKARLADLASSTDSPSPLVPPSQSQPVSPTGSGAIEFEMLCLAIIREISGLDITPTSSLMDSGLHSLHLATLAQKLSRKLGHQLSVLALFRHPNVRSLAAELTSRTKGEAK